MNENFDVWYENEGSEPMSVSDIFYLVKEYRLIEVWLWNWYAIRQWKDIPMTIEHEGETIDVQYWTVYCSSGNNVIESVWTWRGEDELAEYIQTCLNYI